MTRSHASAKTPLVSDHGRPGCPRCGLRLRFGTDRDGRATEACGCGYRGFVAVHPPPTAPLPK